MRQILGGTVMAAAVTAFMGAPTGVAGQAATAKAQLQQNLGDVGLVGNWIYDDLPGAFAEAKRLSKPMLVVFRCVP